MRHYIARRITNPNGPVDIVLVGAGGTGSRLLSGLAQMHHALRALDHPGLSLHVVDGDMVSEANVGRQLFSPSDVGRNKAEVLVTRLNLFFGLGWKAYPIMASGGMKLRGLDRPELLITAVDSAKARRKVSGRRALYWLDTGNTMDTGQVVLGTKTQVEQPRRAKHTVACLPTVLDLYPDMEKHDGRKQGPSCSVAEALERQDLFINQWVANAALHLLWRGFRKGYLTEHGAFINLKTFSVRPLPVDPEFWKRMGWNEPPEIKDAREKKKVSH